MTKSRPPFHDFERVVSPWSRVAIFTHERPDGDALGCVIALARLLQGIGKQVTPVLFNTDLPRYARLLKYAEVVDWNRIDGPSVLAAHDGLVIADTCAFSQLLPIAALLRANVLPTVVIDHHVTRDDIAEYYIIDETASSASLLVAELAETAGWDIDRPTAEVLFTGMATDTGWFRFSNTDARTLRGAARLLEYDVRPHQLYESYYLSDSPARLRLLGRMLSDMELHFGGRLATASITPVVMTQCGAGSADTEDLVNEMLRMGAVQAAFLFVEMNDGLVKVSLRSKKLLDCAAVAARLGGGGHRRAAGLRVTGPLRQVQHDVMQAAQEELREETGENSCDSDT